MQSRTGGHFFLSNGTNNAPNNDTVLHTSQIIKSVKFLSEQAELGALYLNAHEAMPCWTILNELGQK